MLTQTLSYLSGQQLHVVVEEASSAALHWHNELGTGDLDEMDGASKSCGARLVVVKSLIDAAWLHLCRWCSPSDMINLCPT
ncbi:uncharacterized protein LOC144008050 isoform X3 [Festucalex cinctus]